MQGRTCPTSGKKEYKCDNYTAGSKDPAGIKKLPAGSFDPAAQKELQFRKMTFYASIYVKFAVK